MVSRKSTIPRRRNKKSVSKKRKRHSSKKQKKRGKTKRKATPKRKRKSSKKMRGSGLTKEEYIIELETVIRNINANGPMRGYPNINDAKTHLEKINGLDSSINSPNIFLSIFDNDTNLFILSKYEQNKNKIKINDDNLSSFLESARHGEQISNLKEI